jgi:hypothetical protein
MKYDSVAITMQPNTKIALIRLEVNVSVMQNCSFFFCWGETGRKGDSSLRSCRLSSEQHEAIYGLPITAVLAV